MGEGGEGGREGEGGGGKEGGGGRGGKGVGDCIDNSPVKTQLLFIIMCTCTEEEEVLVQEWKWHKLAPAWW
jgi:hypothetical protein